MLTLIIGGGIAGTTLAHYYQQDGRSFVLIDPQKSDTSSKIAAGIINPISFKRLLLGWMANEFLAEAMPFYRIQEAFLKEKIIYPASIIKALNNFDQKAWDEKAKQIEFEPFLSLEDEFIPNTPIRGRRVLQSCSIDTRTWLEGFARKLAADGKLRAEIFDYTKLQKIDQRWAYFNPAGDVEIFDQVIFAEGVGVAENPFFKHLPVVKTKGELLIAEIPRLFLKNIWNKKQFIQPMPYSSKYKIGSTFHWHDFTSQPTLAAAQELLEGINWLPYQLDISARLWGFRPTVPDRKPILGEHPEHKGLFIFNGLGAKGVLIAPYWAKRLYLHLTQQIPIAQEVHLARFKRQ
jgi:glycine/D-amino acid oxidase-like deaminating enzyme